MTINTLKFDFAGPNNERIFIFKGMPPPKKRKDAPADQCPSSFQCMQEIQTCHVCACQSFSPQKQSHVIRV